MEKSPKISRRYIDLFMVGIFQPDMSTCQLTPGVSPWGCCIPTTQMSRKTWASWIEKTHRSSWVGRVNCSLRRSWRSLFGYVVEFFEELRSQLGKRRHVLLTIIFCGLLAVEFFFWVGGISLLGCLFWVPSGWRVPPSRPMWSHQAMNKGLKLAQGIITLSQKPRSKDSVSNQPTVTYL